MKAVGTIDTLLVGAAAGVAGTVAMTAAMIMLHRRLPPSQRYPLPPRELTERVVRRPSGYLDSPTLPPLTMAAHLAYGAAMGSLYGAITRKPAAASGALFGIAVWGVSYLGWIPVVGLLRSATTHPNRRNALMIGVHVVWGGVTGIAVNALRSAEREIFETGMLADAPIRATLDSPG